MSSTLIYMRMFAYIFTIVMHVTNILFVWMSLEKDVLEHPQLKEFSKLQSRYFTCWTFFLQIVHAIAGLLCDSLLLLNAKNETYKLPRRLRGFKNTLFSGVLWPSTLVVVSVFWSLFWYDRRLIYPSFVDKVLTSVSNHVMHSAILPVVLWEVVCQPRPPPRSHTKYIKHLAFHLSLYFLVLTYTYIEKGMWIYPIFSILYGSVYFPLIHVTIASLALTFYYIQWPLSQYFHGEREKIKSS